MDEFPWLPVGFDIGQGTLVGRMVGQGPGYQLLRSSDGQRSAILVELGSVAATGTSSLMIENVPVFGEIAFGSKRWMAATFDVDGEPTRVLDIARRPRFLTGNLASALGAALDRLGRESPEASWGGSVFMPSAAACLPTMIVENEDRSSLAVALLTGGIEDAGLSARQIRAVNPWLTEPEIESFIGKLTSPRQKRTETRQQVEFRLPGRPQLESFIREYVIDHHINRARYEAMGVRPPNGILLWGPPGSGKSFTIQKVVKFLGWPLFDLNLSRIGSPYIHQTGVLLSKAFEEAAKAAPSIVLIEEIDALGGGRTAASHDHKIEEVAELLRLVEGASAHGILVLATTNRRSALDEALIRKGRFDHSIEVGYPGAEEAAGVLDDLIGERPHVAGINIGLAAAKLAGRPVSDIAWVVNEAARSAVRVGKEAIDDVCLFGAISRLA